MNPELLAIILKDIVISEVAAVIRAHVNASGGKMPTDEEILAALDVNADRVIRAGERWLAAHHKG